MSSSSANLLTNQSGASSGINSSQYEGGGISVIYSSDKRIAIIEYPSMIRQKISIQLADISGKVVVLKDFSTNKGINRFTITAQQQGLYIVNILTGDKHFNTKVILNGQVNNRISYSGYKETENYGSPLKSITGDDYVLLYSTGDIISYEFYSGESTTIINQEAGAAAMLSPEFHGCTDYEGNSYSIVKIGEQWWMAENLRSTRYADGTEFLLLEDSDRWSHLAPTEKAYCFYNNDESLNYGALFTHSAAIGHDVISGKQGICPDGWYLPGNDEWMELENYLINNGFNYDCTSTDNKIGKSLASTSGWSISDHIEGAVGNVQTTNNSTGFNAIPAGFRSNESGVFMKEDFFGNWWSRTEHSDLTAETWYLDAIFSSLNHHFNHKSTGNSVRCIKNQHNASIANFIADKTEVSVGDPLTFTDLSLVNQQNGNGILAIVLSQQNKIHLIFIPHQGHIQSLYMLVIVQAQKRKQIILL